MVLPHPLHSRFYPRGPYMPISLVLLTISSPLMLVLSRNVTEHIL